MNFTIKETSSEESDRQNVDLTPTNIELGELVDDSPFDDSQSMESRSKPINLGQHAIDLEEDEKEDELVVQKKQESIYNISGQAVNFRISQTELYGFVAWMLSALFTILFTVWAWTPTDALNKIGIVYLPNKYYVIAFAHWVGVSGWCYVAGLDAISMMKSHPRSNYFTMQDRFTKLMLPRQQIQKESQSTSVQDKKRQNFKEKGEAQSVQKPAEQKVSGGRISEIQDLPITVVNNVLYQKYMNQSFFD